MYQYEGKRVVGPNGERGIVRNGQIVPDDGGTPSLRQIVPAQPKQPTPQTPYQVQQDRGQAEAAPYAGPKAAADTAKAQAEAEFARRKAQADALKAEADARAAATAAQQGFKPTEGQSASAAFYGRALNANRGYGDGVEPRGVVGDTLAHTLPEGVVKKFTSDERKNAEAYAKEFIAATLRKESGAAIGKDEFEQQYSRYFPMPGDGPQQIEIKRHLREEQIRALQMQSGPLAGQVESRLKEEEQAQKADLAQLPRQMQMSDGRTKYVADPAQEAINRRLGSMVARGVSDDKIRDYAARVGVDPKSLDQALQFRRTPGFRAWKRQNPNSAYPVQDPGSNVPTTGTERLIAQTAASPIGSFVAHAGNAAVMGQLPTVAGALGDNPDRIRLGLHDMSAANPKASLGGDVAGAAADYAIGGGVMGRVAGSTAGKVLPNWITATPQEYRAFTGRALAGDAIYGGASGYGDTGTVEGALGGAALGAAGGAAGRKLAGTVGSVISPTGGRASQLYEMGVRPSPGQRAGGILNNVEQRLQDVPVFGDFIRGTRQRARDQFERGVFDDALKEIGDQLPKGTQLGTQAHAYMQKAFNKAYETARSGMVFVADDEFTTGANQLIADAKAGALSPEAAKRLDNVYKNMILRRAKDGVATGNQYKLTASQLGKMAAGATDPEFKSAVQELGSLFDNAARRHSSKDAVAALDKADAGYAKAVRIEDAARRRGGDTGRFNPNQYDAAVQNMSSGVRSRDYLSGKALNTDMAESGKMLSDTIPDSGTVQRTLNALGVNAVAGGSGLVNGPLTAGVLGGIGAVYAPGMRNLSTELMAPRSFDLARRGGALFRGAGARGAGVAGNATIEDYYRRIRGY